MTPTSLSTVITDHPFVVDLYRALSAENVSFSTFALMLAAYHYREPISIARLSILTGASYHATRNQIRRTPWFIVIQPETSAVGANQSSGPLVMVKLTPDAEEKLLRIGRRLSPP
jgi:hypothetical protein